MKPTDKQIKLALFFNALAHPRRQMIFQLLQASGSKGLMYKHLQQRSGLTRATLSFHLGKMGEGRILHRKVKGAETWYSINRSALALFDIPFTPLAFHKTG